MAKAFRKKNIVGLYFIIPGIILYSMFVIYPIFSTIPYSFNNWSGIGDKTFVGFDNYLQLFTHPRLSSDFFNALKHNFKYILYGVAIGIPLNVFLGYLIYRKIFGSKVFQTIIFAPYFINVITIGFMITLFFDSQIGLYSKFMNLLGLDKFEAFPWYGNPDRAIEMTYLVNVWKNIGYFTLLVVANFRLIPKELEEAATIDGANEWRFFWHICLPHLKPSLTNILVLTYIWSLSMFEIPFVLGGVQGGVGKSMDFLGVFFYRTAFGQGFQNSMGMGTTIAVCMFAIILIGAIVQIALITKTAKRNN